MNKKLAALKVGVSKGGLHCSCCRPWSKKTTRTMINRLVRRTNKQIVWRNN